MPKWPIVLVGGAVLLLAGCATRGPATMSDDAGAILSGSGETSAYGQFLAGQAAADHGENATAQAYFGKAARLEAGSEKSLLGARAFTSALLAGDIPAAAAAAPTDPSTDASLKHLSALVRAVEAMADNKPRLAREILTGPDSGAPDDVAVALLTPFAAAAAGDAEASVVQPVIKGEPIAQFFASLDQGKLFERARRYEEAETAFKALIAKGDPGGLASLSLGAMLERLGRSSEAVAIYDAALEAKKGGQDLRDARARAIAHGQPPALSSLRTQAADALIAPATALLLDKQEQIALAYLRLALRLDPTRDEGWLLVGDILSDTGDAAGAREALAKVQPKSSQYLAARIKLAWNQQASGDKESAIATARETVAQRPEDQEAAVTLADLLRANERYDESAKILDGLIGDKGAAADWKLLYMRAVDNEESGRWADAERDLQAALKQRPDEPELLNFLGYSWIDRGERLPEAMAMVQKAVSLQPQSGAMIDSLGWGYFKMGDYRLAVAKLEEAVALEPGDPDVNNHLGDAYWKVGRRTEATYQWRRVLSLDPSAKLRDEVQTKIDHGLEGAPAKPVVAGR